MLRHRIKSLVVVAAMLLSSGAALGQPLDGHQGPFRPSNVRYDLELFAPPDLSTYGNWPRPNEGFWFQYDRLYMSIQQPTRTEIGVPGGESVGFFNGPPQFDPTTQPINQILKPYENSIDTGFLRADQTWGNRFELGYMEDNKGWFVSIFNLQDQVQNYAAGAIDDTDPDNLGRAGVTIVFRDPNQLLLGFVDTDGDGADDDLNATGPITPTNRVYTVFGRPKIENLNNNLSTNNDFIFDAYAGFTDFGDMVPLVPIFETINIQNVTSMAGVELNRSWRWDPLHNGGIMEWFVGVRWLQYRNRFSVQAFTTPGFFDTVGLPGNSFWNSLADNNMFGPQIGFRYKHSLARFSVMTELRFLAAANFQSIHLDGEIASGLASLPEFPDEQPTNVPLNLVRTSFNNWQSDQTFAPVGELRAGVSYQLTKAFSVQAGYNAMLGGGISQGSRRIDYVLPALKILDTNKHDAWFVNGLNIGITCNR